MSRKDHLRSMERILTVVIWTFSALLILWLLVLLIGGAIYILVRSG